jgi:Homing endonuclease associated repeat
MSYATRKKPAAGDAYCPHCHLLIERKVGDDWPEEPQRCPHCRLLVGVGRAKPTPAAEPGARGSAAGVFAHEARRAGGESSSSKAEVCQAIRDVAEEVGSRPERLLMVDYQQRASDDDDLPSLSDVFAAFGSWKRARRAAAKAA